MTCRQVAPVQLASDYATTVLLVQGGLLYIWKLHAVTIFCDKYEEQPDNHQKYLSGSESFDKKFDVYATEEKEAEKLLSSKLMKNFEKLFAKGTIAAFIDGKHAYLVISRKKDVMEAPLYSPMDPKRCEKEASIEVDIIRNWIELLKN